MGGGVDVACLLDARLRTLLTHIMEVLACDNETQQRTPTEEKYAHESNVRMHKE